MNVLVVDDSPSMLLWLKTVLEPLGHTTYTAGSGREALEVLAKEEIGLVMTDLAMPEMNGAQLLREVRRLYAHLPVVVMSGVGSVEDAVELLRLGADEFLAKPLRQDELLSCLNRVAEKAKVYAAARLFTTIVRDSRERPPTDRLGELLAHFAAKHGSPARAFSLEALDVMMRWTGSAAQFEAVIEAAVRAARGPVIERHDVLAARDSLEEQPAPAAEEAPRKPPIPAFDAAMRVVVERFEKLYLEKLLSLTNKLDEAARIAQLDPHRLTSLLERHELIEAAGAPESFLSPP